MLGQSKFSHWFLVLRPLHSISEGAQTFKWITFIFFKLLWAVASIPNFLSHTVIHTDIWINLSQGFLFLHLIRFFNWHTSTNYLVFWTFTHWEKLCMIFYWVFSSSILFIEWGKFKLWNLGIKIMLKNVLKFLSQHPWKTGNIVRF